MNQLSIIEQRQVLGKHFCIYGTLENPLFLAKDVAEWIEHSNPSKMITDAGLDESEIAKITISYDGDGCRISPPTTQLFLTEDGLYEVLMQSRKPIAKQFKKKVKEILKSIRKNGGYIANQESLTPEQVVAQALIVANNIIEEKDRQLEAQKPKVLFADAVSASKSSILIGELAKILKQNGVDTGQNRLFDWLRRNGYLISRKGTDYNMPTQRAMELGLFEIKETTITHSDGHISISKTVKTTGKGQQYFVNKFIKKGAVSLC